jgi:hypothetical protein
MEHFPTFIYHDPETNIRLPKEALTLCLSKTKIQPLQKRVFKGAPNADFSIK